MSHIVLLDDQPLIGLPVREMFSHLLPSKSMLHIQSLTHFQKSVGLATEVLIFDPHCDCLKDRSWKTELPLLFPKAQCIGLSAGSSSDSEQWLAQNGGLFVLKTQSYRSLVQQVQGFLKLNRINTDLAAQRNSYQSLIQYPGAAKPLTWRQARVMDSCSQGYSAKEISEMMGMSAETVKAHMREAINRLQARSRSEAVKHFTIAYNHAVKMYGDTVVESLNSFQE